MEKEFLAKGVALKPGAKELLTYLKEHGYKIALASSSIADRAYGILDQHGIRGCFDAFVFGPDLPKGRGKPAPDIFLIACQKLGTTPARALVLEDSEAGIQAAHSARIPVLCVPDLHHPAPAYESMTAAIPLLPARGAGLAGSPERAIKSRTKVFLLQPPLTLEKEDFLPVSAQFFFFVKRVHLFILFF